MKTLPLALLLSLAACAGPRKTATVKPLAPPIAATIAAGLAEIEPLAPEPLGCPIYDGDDRPDYDSQGLDCLVKWIQEAREYLSAGGKPTAHTSADRIEKNRALARKLAGRIDTWLSGARSQAAARLPTARRSAAIIIPKMEPTADSQASQQSYLSGMIYFQKGDYDKARKEWLMSVKLDPTNSDAKAGLAKLDELLKTP